MKTLDSSSSLVRFFAAVTELQATRDEFAVADRLERQIGELNLRQELAHSYECLKVFACASRHLCSD
jgi:hypothetical protein